MDTNSARGGWQQQACEHSLCPDEQGPRGLAGPGSVGQRGFPAGPWARALLLPASVSSFVNGNNDYHAGGLLRTQDIGVIKEGAQYLPHKGHQ